MTQKKQIVDEGLTRRRFIQAGAGATVAAGFLPGFNLRGTGFAAQQPPSPSVKPLTKLVPPAQGKIPVAFVIGQGGAETIDFVGPMEVFTFAFFPARGGSMEGMQPFQNYIVSDSTKPFRVTGGMKIIPDYSFADAPEPKVVVVPATRTSPEMLDWIRKMTKRCDVVMSVCLGAYHLAEAGVLAGKKATTNDGPYVDIQRKYPDVHFVRNMRWVQSDPVIFTAGATGAGIDLALHIVDSISAAKSRSALPGR